MSGGPEVLNRRPARWGLPGNPKPGHLANLVSTAPGWWATGADLIEETVGFTCIQDA